MFDYVPLNQSVSTSISSFETFTNKGGGVFNPFSSVGSTSFEREVQKVFDQCAEKDWDGYGAKPLHRTLQEKVIRFLRSLPSHVSVPEVVPEPDGAVALEWANSKHQVLSLSIDLSDQIAFAWLDGAERGKGVLRSRASFPEKITALLESIFGFRREQLPDLKLVA
jgi:hypothetical protein